MSDESQDEEFEAIVSSEEEGEDPNDSEEELETLWEVVEATWPLLHKDQGILVRGMMLVEIVTPDGFKDLRFLASPEMMPWDIQGFIKHASSEVDIENLLDMLISAQIDSTEDDEEE
jgi:hypothetical protein